MSGGENEMGSPERKSFQSEYEKALDSLSSLIIRRIRADGMNKGDQFDLMLDYLKILELEEPISKMKVIHVAGTKGKGSTCTFTESILRNCGFHTGLFTSPHLIDVRERFKLDGVEICEEKFLAYFWWCWDKLKDKTNEDVPMPTYFRFLVLLGFKIFAEEQVDVAILEVGLGGKFDATNVVQSPIVCGISSLGYDHMEILGNTLGEIAGQKAGIFKHGVPAFTVPQPQEAMSALEYRASQLGITLQVATPLDIRLLNGQQLGLDGEHQYLNAGLAIALCYTWLQKTGQTEGIYFDQTILLFNCMPVRDPQLLLPPLRKACARHGVHFQKALFVPNQSVFNKVGSHTMPSSDPPVDLSWQLTLQRVWESLIHSDKGANDDKKVDSISESRSDSETYNIGSDESSSVFSPLPLAIKWLRDSAQKNQSVRYQAAVAEDKKGTNYEVPEASLQIFPPNNGGDKGWRYQPSGSSNGGAGGDEQTTNRWKGVFSISSYSPYFNVDTDVVVDRIKGSLHPINRNFFEKIEDNPDMYGPVWISTTLVFMLAALGNCATYLMQKRSDKSTAWSFDVSYVNWAACAIYGYVLVVPLAFYFLLQYLGLNASLTRLWCMWGYSLFIFIISSFLLVVPAEFFRWIIIIAAGSASACFVALNMNSYIPGNDLTVVVVSALALQLALAIFIKICFFP